MREEPTEEEGASGAKPDKLPDASAGRVIDGEAERQDGKEKDKEKS